MRQSSAPPLAAPAVRQRAIIVSAVVVAHAAVVAMMLSAEVRVDQPPQPHVTSVQPTTDAPLLGGRSAIPAADEASTVADAGNPTDNARDASRACWPGGGPINHEQHCCFRRSPAND